MRKVWIFVIIAGIAIVAMSAFQYLTRPGAGDVAPLFALDSIEGKQVELAGFAGRPVLLHFFASWCGPCRAEFPQLSAVQDEFEEEGLAVLGVAEDEEMRPIRVFVEMTKPSFPVLLDMEGKVADSYMSYAIPETIFVDREGMIRWRHAGPVEWKGPAARARIKDLITRQ
jgi:cytochrome c biogenesis protein CcmG/thiol:disulfide interchange protein DsbE